MAKFSLYKVTPKSFNKVLGELIEGTPFEIKVPTRQEMKLSLNGESMIYKDLCAKHGINNVKKELIY